MKWYTNTTHNVEFTYVKVPPQTSQVGLIAAVALPKKLNGCIQLRYVATTVTS